jgi:squalene-hopene/tetraprenyl-beta-curcumene cyclase
VIQNQTDRRSFLRVGLGAVGLLGVPGIALARREQEPADARALMAKGVAFLRSRQGEEGGWSADRNPGITALVVAALLKSGVTPFDPAVAKGLEFMEGFVGPEGNKAEGAQANYQTSIALMAFDEAEKKGAKGRYSAIIRGGQEKLRGLQWDESEGKGPDDPFYGGAGYGSKSRPDVSNTAFFLEALRQTGVPADDEAMKKAVVFLSRCQNLGSEFNDQPWAGKVDDGGFIYSTYGGGESPAGEAPGGGLRSYGSMTYNGLKSMIYAGLTADDPRVKAAREYIAKNYTLAENPAMGQSGLYYYYQTFAKALSALGEEKLTDAAGVEHDWRADLVAALAERQGPNGEWVNPADRWMEGDPNLVTGYALLALAAATAKG